MKKVKLLFQVVIIIVGMLFLIACSSVCERKGHDYYIESNYDGTHTWVCAFDSSHYKDEACLYGEWEVILEPQEFSKGVEFRSCIECNYTDKRIIPELHVHEYSDYWIIDKEATMDSVGSKSYHCLKYGCNDQTNVTEIPILLYSDGLTYELNNEKNGYIILSVGECSDTNIKITPNYKNLPVVEIKENAFSNCTNLRSIEIPDSIISIGDNAFSNCELLTNITIPDSTMYIGKSILSNCNNLCGISIPFLGEKLDNAKETHLGYLFNDSSDNRLIPSSLVEVNVTKATKIGLEAFSNCEGLKNIVLPNTLKLIGKDAFSSCLALTEIIIPNNVTSIGEYAFYNCRSLIEIEIPQSVKYIGKAIFLNCDSITKISIPFIGSTYNDDTNKNIAYIFNDKANNIYIQPSLKEIVVTYGQKIGDGAFKSCKYVEKITITPYIISIGNEAFSGCTSLKEFIMPINVVDIGNNAFSNCVSLSNVIIAETVINIGDYAFSDCTALKELIIPKGVENIGKSICENCTSIEEITIPFVGANINDEQNLFLSYFFNEEFDNSLIPSSLISVTVTGGNKINSESFFGCEYLIQINILGSITSIETGAFFDCIALEELNIPDSVTNIGNIAFYNCASLKKIELPDSLMHIGDAALYNCTLLTEIVIPNNVTTIGESAFESCTSLKKITISNNITNIGNNAFKECLLDNVYYNGIIDNWNKISFGEEYSNLKDYTNHFYVLDNNNEYYEIINDDSDSLIPSKQE